MSQNLSADQELVSDVVATNHPAAADPVTLRAIQKAIALIELRFTPQGESH